MRTIICAMCGKTVEISGYARRVKYCPECKPLAKEMWRIRQEERRGERERMKGKGGDDIFPMATPEEMATCLGCPLPECRQNSLVCPLRRKGMR